MRLQLIKSEKKERKQTERKRKKWGNGMESNGMECYIDKHDNNRIDE